MGWRECLFYRVSASSKKARVLVPTVSTGNKGELATATARAATGKELEEEKLAFTLNLIRSSTGGLNLKPSVNAGSLAKGLKNLDPTEFDEPSKQALSNAKRRFKESRKKATDALNNTALRTSDRILAMTIRVMANLLETVDNPSTALSSCRVCLDELHNLPAVQNSIKVELEKGVQSLFKRNERGKVITDVLHINYVIYTVSQMVSGGGRYDAATSACIDIGNRTIDPLREVRLAETLHEVNMEHCFLMWSFGQEGEKEHRPRGPKGIATNKRDDFIVADIFNRNVKVFNTSGKFLYSLHLPTGLLDPVTVFQPIIVATDGKDNVYVLAMEISSRTEWIGVYVFDQHANLHRKFPLREGYLYPYSDKTVAVSDHQVFVLLKRDDGYQVDVHDMH